VVLVATPPEKTMSVPLLVTIRFARSDPRDVERAPGGTVALRRSRLSALTVPSIRGCRRSRRWRCHDATIEDIKRGALVTVDC